MSSMKKGMSKVQAGVALALNILLLVFVAYAVLRSMFIGGEGNMQMRGTYMLMFFTVDSNILVGVTALFVIPGEVAILRGRGRGNGAGESGAFLSRGALTLKFVGTVAVTLTFMTVMCFLGPLTGFGPMLGGSNFFMHLVNPLLAIASLVLCERAEGGLGKGVILAGLIPTIVYGAVYFTMVIIVGFENGGWFDFYGFNRGGMWPLSIVAMLGATTLIAVLERLPLRKKKAK